MKVKDYLKYEKEKSVGYILPGDGKAIFQLDFDDYLQTYGRSTFLSGSLSSTDILSKNNIVHGKIPEKKYEIVVDKLIYKRIMNESQSINQAGIGSAKELIGKKVKINYMPEFTIVGITDEESPCIYASPKLFTNILANSQTGEVEGDTGEESAPEGNESGLVDVKLVKKDIKLEKGRMPKANYEVLVNKINETEMPLNKDIKEKVNGKKLHVVGYYSSKKDEMDQKLVTKGTIKRNLINKSKNITVYPKDKEETIAAFEAKSLNIIDIYKYERDKYKKEVWPMIKSTVIMAIIIIGISFIEIFLIMRASFLSRIKEIGTLRAIGVKKSDIYKIFTGETFAITVLASLPGYILMSYIVEKLSHIKYMQEIFKMNASLFVIGILGILVFNIIVGLLPVFFTMRKTPAAILARTDIQ